MPDNRTVSVKFEAADGSVKITETFDADNEYPVEMQREGWQSILQNYKRYVEGKTIR